MDNLKHADAEEQAKTQQRAEQFGKTILMIAVIGLFLYKFSQGLPYWDLYALFFCYSASIKMYQFKSLKSNYERILAVGECVLAVLAIIAYIKHS